MTVADLRAAIEDVPATYRVLLCDDAAYPGTNWTDTWRVEIDHGHAVVRCIGACT
jgi:hypothetical protein